MQFDSLDFWSEHARRYSQLSHEFTHSVYTGSSHPALTGDLDLLNRVVEMARENGGLDAGCGAGARDVHLLQAWGYDTYGIDAVEENISLGRELHPEIADKLSAGDLRDPLCFESGFLDFVLWNAVIRHLTPEATETTAIPELARVPVSGGILQMMFKTGSGVATVSDGAYGVDGVARSFQLYDEHRLLGILEDCGALW